MELTVTYDRAADGAFIRFAPVKVAGVAHTVEAVPQTIMLDFDRDGYLVGIEVLAASRLLPRAVWKKAARPRILPELSPEDRVALKPGLDLRVTYSHGTDTATVYLRPSGPGDIKRAVEAPNRNVALNFDCREQLVTVVVRGASRLLHRDVREQAEQVE